MADIELLVLHSNTWNHLTVCKQMSCGLFKMLLRKYLFTNNIYIYIYIYIKQELALNNLQGLVCHKTQPIKINTDMDNQSCYKIYGSPVETLNYTNVITFFTIHLFTPSVNNKECVRVYIYIYIYIYTHKHKDTDRKLNCSTWTQLSQN